MYYESYYELYHYGTKGMEHGKRRYQNPDGTWTEEGKRRRRNGSEKKAVLKKETSKQPQKESVQKEAPVKTNPKKMSDSELKSAIERFNLEKQYYEAKNNSQSNSKKFVREVMHDIGKKALTDVGAKVATAALSTLFGDPIIKALGDAVKKKESGNNSQNQGNA